MNAIGFTPSRKFLYTKLFQGLLTGSLALGFSTLIGSWIGGWLGGLDGAVTGRWVSLTINLAWLIPSLILMHSTYRSLFYEIHEDEVVMHAGVITRRATHVPFRMITNLEIRRGPFDRLFKLGTINIQTAGSIEYTVATENLVGLRNFKEIYDHLTSAIKRTLTCSHQKVEYPIPIDHEMLKSLLEEMKKIRILLEVPEHQG